MYITLYKNTHKVSYDITYRRISVSHWFVSKWRWLNVLNYYHFRDTILRQTHVSPFGARPLVLLLRSFLAPNLQTESSLQHWGLQLACENVLSLSVSLSLSLSLFLACFFLQLLLSSEVSGSGQVLVANMLSSGSHPSLQTCEPWRNGSSASHVRCTWISGAEGAKAEIIWNFSRFLNVSHLVRLEATHPARKSGIKGSRKKTKKTYFRIIE